MSVSISETRARELAPIGSNERIQALDVIRGFALIGIFLMNVEWFTRPIAELGSGVDVSQTGLSYVASWLVYTFVQGKFWTMFSLLFGMGFAVMLSRAESSERAFATPYVRRIVGLFLFGAAHFVLIWTGDILQNYAITALLLLLIVSQSWKAWLALLLWVCVVGYGFATDSLLTSLVALGAAAGAAWLIFRGTIDRWYKLAALVLTAVAASIATGPTSPDMALAAILLGLVAVLMYVLNRGSLDRYYKLGAGMYALVFVGALLFIAAVLVNPELKPGGSPEAAAERAERAIERQHERAEEVRVLTSASYPESVVHRAGQYREHMSEAVGGSILTLPLFLIGFWFARSGVMAQLRQNLPLFRRLLRWTLPLGLGITLASVWLHSNFPPGSGRQNSVALARTLFELGALPLSIGYFSALVCLLGTGWGERLLSPLRHAGRMALTNYLGASVIGTLFFSGYGLGYYGQVSRGGQVVFVAAVFALQLAFSYLWLSKFRYGPMEWLWRAITYWQLPSMRRERTAANSLPAGATKLASRAFGGM